MSYATFCSGVFFFKMLMGGLMKKNTLLAVPVIGMLVSVVVVGCNTGNTTTSDSSPSTGKHCTVNVQTNTLEKPYHYLNGSNTNESITTGLFLSVDPDALVNNIGLPTSELNNAVYVGYGATKYYGTSYSNAGLLYTVNQTDSTGNIQQSAALVLWLESGMPANACLSGLYIENLAGSTVKTAPANLTDCINESAELYQRYSFSGTYNIMESGSIESASGRLVFSCTVESGPVEF